MKTTKIIKGVYRTENNYIIRKTVNGWEVQNEVDGTVYYTTKTKKQAISYCIY